MPDSDDGLARSFEDVRVRLRAANKAEAVDNIVVPSWCLYKSACGLDSLNHNELVELRLKEVRVDRGEGEWVGGGQGEVSD